MESLGKTIKRKSVDGEILSYELKLQKLGVHAQPAPHILFLNLLNLFWFHDVVILITDNTYNNTVLLKLTNA